MENWKFALSSIMGHKMRSFLTMLGIIIGVASVVVIMALGQGMTKQITDMFSADTRDIEIYYVAKDSDSKSIFDDDVETTSSDKGPKIQEEWLQKITSDVSGVQNYYLTNGTTATVSLNKKKAKNVNIIGVNKTYFDVKKYKVVAGRNFRSDDYEHFSRIIMLDTKLAVKLFGTNDNALNKQVSVGSKSYLVVGVYKDPNAGSALYGMSSGGNAVMTNTQLAAEFNVNEIEAAYVHVNDATQATTVGEEAAKVMTQVSGVKTGHFTIFDMSKQIAEINSAYGMMTTVIGAIAGISLLVGGIGVMNIMLVSVTERTREIGLRKALGATRRKILTQFLIESMVLTLLGGLIGLGLAAGLTSILNSNMADMKPSISFNVAIGSLLFSALIGMIFGILPANKASKLDPIEALRYE
ncbi:MULTISPECIES: ABC transporter permease [Streptococcus]|jgi:putative ABC transport system permease protein|uniref:ABC transport system permease n=2 Tax=Lactobacillales TaxID=186826 RepID=A0A139R7L8_9STRE|nr:MULTISPECIES: ABC transporter permease [Streptococcus]AQP42368.1 ABC transporter permease [Streptococcus gallolyticus subsp. gallolyticus DSM 16831]EFM29514.1 efflux ABC transporter, permease protein [Streptococcus gallolyticus subsp. gallolyticus TX20005]KXT68090.1 ABC transporter permease protein [Streptococcus gallolyticus]KXU10739.1 ABC transporter permease protein [Streptococcus gallolyticus]MCF0239318.1 ABC transporter permease [Streptococcus gallolyticus]